MNGRDSDDAPLSGHELESGMLARARQWTDLLPWLRLVRTLRAAGSPPLILVVAVTMMLWSTVIVIIQDTDDQNTGLRYGGVAVVDPSQPDGSIVEIRLSSPAIVASIERLIDHLVPTTVFGRVAQMDQSLPLWRDLLGTAWSLFIWMPAVMLLVRQGALLTADRPMTGLRRGVTTALRLTPLAWLIAIVPLACSLALATLIWLPGWLSRISVAASLESALALLAILIALPCGILVFGASIAVPLGWAAAANERDRDALDSLSRGYEYLMRRPLQLAWYALVSLILLALIGLLSAAVAEAAGHVIVAALKVSGSSPSFPQTANRLLAYFPLVVTLTLFWSLVGGVYLLLRFDAGGQEVEDLWQSPVESNPPLPSRD